MSGERQYYVMEKSLKSYGTKEAAEFLRISPGSICSRAASGELVGYKPGRRWVFLEDDLIKYLKSTRIQLPKEPHIPRISDLSSKEVERRLDKLLGRKSQA